MGIVVYRLTFPFTYTKFKVLYWILKLDIKLIGYELDLTGIQTLIGQSIF